MRTSLIQYKTHLQASSICNGNLHGNASQERNYQNGRSSCFSWYLLQSYKMFNWLKVPHFVEASAHKYHVISQITLCGETCLIYYSYMYFSGFYTGQCNSPWLSQQRRLHSDWAKEVHNADVISNNSIECSAGDAMLWPHSEFIYIF